jgi:hypothetical protein
MQTTTYSLLQKHVQALTRLGEGKRASDYFRRRHGRNLDRNSPRPGALPLADV